MDKNNFNPYEDLSLPLYSSHDLIKAAYRKLSLEFHPDKTATEDYTTFVKITNAYKFLMVNKPIYDNMI